MNRWFRIACTSLAFAAAAASAQVTTERGAPLGVKPAIIAVSATPPLIQVEGKDDRFSPGARIRDRENRLVLTGTLANLGNLGLPQALSGPLSRGDSGTVAGHLAALDALNPDIAALYRALGRATAALALEKDPTLADAIHAATALLDPPA